MDISKIAPYAKSVVAAGGAALTTINSIVAIAALGADGVVSGDDITTLISQLSTIVVAWGVVWGVYQIKNKVVS